MEFKLIEAQLEAILFTMGEAIELDRLALAIDHDEDTTRKLLQNMMDNYDDECRGIHIIELDGAYQLCTKASMYEAIIRITHIPKKHILTEVLLETLSIIAYKQPITRLQLEAIRGVKSDYPVNKLIEYNLICELGRMDVPGRPILFGTTEEFLRSFGLQSLDLLPAINPEKLEDFKLEAEEEASEQLTLNI